MPAGSRSRVTTSRSSATWRLRSRRRGIGPVGRAAQTGDRCVTRHRGISHVRVLPRAHFARSGRPCGLPGFLHEESGEIDAKGDASSRILDAWVCVLAPHAVPDPMIPIELAESAVAGNIDRCLSSVVSQHPWGRSLPRRPIRRGDRPTPGGYPDQSGRELTTGLGFPGHVALSTGTH